MADVVKQLRANADYWAKNNGDGTARMLTAAADEIAIACRRIAVLEESNGRLADRIQEVRAEAAADAEAPRRAIARFLADVAGDAWLTWQPPHPCWEQLRTHAWTEENAS